MAKIHEEFVIIKLSKLYKGNDTDQLVTDELRTTLEGVVDEMITDETVIIEIVDNMSE